MELYQIILVPIAFGLLGFVEPCSIGANILFLGYLQRREQARLFETVKFTLTRALFLGMIGLAAGVLGQSLRIGTYSYSLVLGLFYTLLGLGALWLGYRRTGLASLDLGRFLPKEGAVPLGESFVGAQARFPGAVERSPRFRDLDDIRRGRRRLSGLGAGEEEYRQDAQDPQRG